MKTRYCVEDVTNQSQCSYDHYRRTERRDQRKLERPANPSRCCENSATCQNKTQRSCWRHPHQLRRFRFSPAQPVIKWKVPPKKVLAQNQKAEGNRHHGQGRCQKTKRPRSFLRQKI